MEILQYQNIISRFKCRILLRSLSWEISLNKRYDQRTQFLSEKNICHSENANKSKNTRFSETLLPAKCHRFCEFASGKVRPLKRTVYLPRSCKSFTNSAEYHDLHHNFRCLPQLYGHMVARYFFKSRTVSLEYDIYVFK